MHSKASRTWECPTSLEDLLCRPTVPGCFPGSFAGLDIPEVELHGLPALRLDAGELSVHLRLLGPKVRFPQIGITSSHARDSELSKNVSNACSPELTSPRRC